jgi:hypothetical protein
MPFTFIICEEQISWYYGAGSHTIIQMYQFVGREYRILNLMVPQDWEPYFNSGLMILVSKSGSHILTQG